MEFLKVCRLQVALSDRPILRAIGYPSGPFYVRTLLRHATKTSIAWLTGPL